MEDSREIELKIHFGGSMKKIGEEDYEYLDELGIRYVEWKIDEIVWDRFVEFCKEDALIRTPLSLIWYKLEKEEMKKLRYVYDSMDEEMGMLRSVGDLGKDVVEVFLEHECSEHIPGVIHLPSKQQVDVDRGDEEEEHSENDEVDRPKEDDEPEESEDENQAQKEIVEDNVAVNQTDTDHVPNENPNDNQDGGDDIVVDEADGSNDVRFQTIFEEGLKSVPDKEAYGDGLQEEEKDDDSDDERAPVDVEYPDTPVDSEDEWDEWNRERRGKGKAKGNDKYHGDFDKPPYIWLFQKFNSGLEFKDQLLKYSMNTQYDVKMARSESHRIGVICCKEKCPFRVYCSVEKPINRWMVKVCHMKHNHGKSSRISMLKQGVIAGLFREELRRNVNLQASAIKDAIKLRYDIVEARCLLQLKTLGADKQKGLVHAIELELPQAEHRMCARHIYANWKKLGFSRSEYKSLFWGVAYSYTEGEYKEKMRLVEVYDAVAHQELLNTEPERWCRAYFNVESHCPDVHNNLSESFNRTIKMARAKPVINMLEDIRRQAMKRISRRFFIADKCDTIVTPITMALLEKARCAKKYCSTLRSSSSLYEVDEFENGYTVNLASHQCACRRWDLTGIPCKHAVCVLDDNQEDPVKYTAEYYYTHMMKRTYNDNIKPVNGENLWKKTGKAPIGIPEIRKPRGRPRTRDRKKEPFEALETAGKSTRHGRVPKCSNCLQTGHIKSGCKNQSVVYEGPKNKRGRPRKYLQEDTPKPPARRKKTTESSSQPVHATGSSSQHVHATGSSSQPLEATGSSSQIHTHSTAPQPSVSSTDPKPHAKKAARGQPLKVRKTGKIPHGFGTLWSPFTNRPFEVFGDRVYDRSKQLPPQSPPHE